MITSVVIFSSQSYEMLKVSFYAAIRLCVWVWCKVLILRYSSLSILQLSKHPLRLLEPQHEISNNVVCATSKVSDQPLLVACIFYEC